VPVLYTYLHRLGERARAFWHRKSVPAAALSPTARADEPGAV